jgi:hypothetical protein
MAIGKELSSYEKAVLSDLQEAWHTLRDEVAGQAGCRDRHRQYRWAW